MKILVAIDGSEHSQYPINAVMARTWPHGTEIRLAYVDNSEGMHRGDKGELMSSDQILFSLATGIQQRMQDVKVDHEIIKGNATAEVIVEAAQRWHADLIVVGCRGGSTIECILLGSVSQAILDKAYCPVMIAKPISETVRENILVAIDDCVYAAHALEWLMAQSWANNAGIYLVSVIEPVARGFALSGNISKASEAMLAWENEKYAIECALHEWKQLVEKNLPNADVYCGVLLGEPRKAILDEALNWPATLIMMGSHGRTGISKLVLGSVSLHMAAEAKCSVLVAKGSHSKYYEHIQKLVQVQTDEIREILSRRPETCSDKNPDLPHGMPAAFG
jgi:nucleotide-binding universal stress UspA family protein